MLMCLNFRCSYNCSIEWFVNSSRQSFDSNRYQFPCMCPIAKVNWSKDEPTQELCKTMYTALN